MRMRRWAMGGVLGALAMSGSAALSAAAPQTRRPWAAPQATKTLTPAVPSSGDDDAATDDEQPQVTDAMIVDLMMHIERLVQRTAAVGARRPSGGAIRDLARRVHAQTGQM